MLIRERRGGEKRQMNLVCAVVSPIFRAIAASCAPAWPPLKFYRLIKKSACASLSRKSKAMGGAPLSNSPLTPGVVPGRLPAAAYAENFADKEPPFDRHEAQVAADRCYFCYDAPCVTACPTSIDIPLFIRQIATDTPEAAAKTIWDAEHPRRHVRPGLPHRTALRRGLRARGRRGQAGRDRAASALCHRHADGARACIPSPAPPPRAAVSRSSARGLRALPVRTGWRCMGMT